MSRNLSDKKSETIGRPASWPPPTTLISRRLQQILPRYGKARLAKIFFTDLSEKGVESILAGKTEPSPSALRRIAEQCGCDLNWLTWGIGTPAAPAAPTASTDNAPVEQTPERGIPVIGLVACNFAGWYKPQPLAVRAPPPVEYDNPQFLFAVVATGDSMIPDGIREGYLLYCDPTVECEEGDAIYIRTKDGNATVKRFIKRDAEWLVTQGWLEPDKSGNQKPFTNRHALDFVDLVACVVMVRRKA